MLFVCTGNICRSPIAERLARAYANGLGIANLTVSSAGTRAMIGHPIHPSAASVLTELGGDASNFAARQLTSRIAGEPDLVITMTTAHRDAVLELAPRQLHKTFTLSEAAGLVSDCNAQSVSDLSVLRPKLASQPPDIPDPIGQDIQFHTDVGTHIARFLPPILGLCRRG